MEKIILLVVICGVSLFCGMSILGGMAILNWILGALTGAITMIVWAWGRNV